MTDPSRAFARQVAAAPPRQRFERRLVAPALDQDCRARLRGAYQATRGVGVERRARARRARHHWKFHVRIMPMSRGPWATRRDTARTSAQLFRPLLRAHRRGRARPCRRPHPNDGFWPGSVNCSSPLKPALGRPRSRIERQLPGEVANSHCRPGAEPRERLLPGTQARRRRLVLPNRGVSRSSRSSNHSPPGTTSAAAEPCHRARSDGRDNRPLGHCGAAIFLRICSRVCSAAAEKGPPRATASLISASASSLRC